MKHNNPSGGMNNAKEEECLLSEMRSVTSHQKNEEEKWQDFVVETNMKKVLKKLDEDNLNSSWKSLRVIIVEKPLSSSLTSVCPETDVLVKILMKSCIEKNECVALYVFLLKCLAAGFPLEAKFCFPLACEAMCQKYIALPSSNEYVSKHGHNFCKFLAYLVAMPRQEEAGVLFESALAVAKQYVKQWTRPVRVDQLDELQEYRLCVDATAVCSLVAEIRQAISPDDPALEGEVENFTRWIEKSSCNDTIPENVRNIYIDGLTNIRGANSNNSDMFPDFLKSIVTLEVKSAPLSAVSMVKRNKQVGNKPPPKKTAEQSRFVNPLMRDKSPYSGKQLQTSRTQPQTTNTQAPQSVQRQSQQQQKQQQQQQPQNQHRHDALVNMLSLKSSKYDSEEPFRHSYPTKGQKTKKNRTHNNNNNNNNDSMSNGYNDFADNIVARINDNHLQTDGFVTNDSKALKRFLSNFACNPREYNIDLRQARCFVLKSNSEDDVFRSIKNSCWTSTKQGNSKLNSVFREQQQLRSPVYLLYSVNGSGHFCGVAEMTSEVDLHVDTGIWVQPKWKGRFEVRWIYVKDIPMNAFSGIRLSNSENKPVSRSRDTQELLVDAAERMLKIIHNYHSDSSIFDDFDHYDQREEEDTRSRAVTDVLHR